MAKLYFCCQNNVFTFPRSLRSLAIFYKQQTTGPARFQNKVIWYQGDHYHSDRPTVYSDDKNNNPLFITRSDYIFGSLASLPRKILKEGGS